MSQSLFPIDPAEALAALDKILPDLRRRADLYLAEEEAERQRDLEKQKAYDSARWYRRLFMDDPRMDDLYYLLHPRPTPYERWHRADTLKENLLKVPQGETAQLSSKDVRFIFQNTTP